MPEEHVVNVNMGRPLTTNGHKDYNILKAEDRAIIAEFLYFLGLIRNWQN